MHTRQNIEYQLAPLAGFTFAPFRLLCARRGASLTYTEMVSAAGLAHGSSPTRHLMELLPGEGPVACQIFGSDPGELAFAAAEADKLGRFTEINLNAGCPMPKIIREGAGAALLRSPPMVHKCLRAIREATSLPVTLKTRPGPRPDAVLAGELLDAAETAGCSAFIIHGRFTSQMHSGPVHYDLLAEIVQRAKIRVVGNGGVYNIPTATRMAETGVDAIMVGRAALANPWLFSGLRKDDPPEVLEAPDRRRRLQNAAFADHLALLLEFQAQLERSFPQDHVPGVDEYVSMVARTHLFRYFNGRPGSAELRRRLNEVHTLAELMAAVAPLMDETAASAGNAPPQSSR